MDKTPVFPKKTYGHTSYRTLDGIKVPGVTTIINQLDKPALVYWANNLGLQGIQCFKYRDFLAEVGTLVHSLIMDFYSGTEKTDLHEYSPQQLDLAENSMAHFHRWNTQYNPKVIYAEKQCVSETYKYGGTFDLYAEIEGEKILIDFKTSDAIYDSHFYQLAGYGKMLEEKNTKPRGHRVVRLPRTLDGTFEERRIDKIDKYWEIFKRLLDIYYIDREIKKCPSMWNSLPF